MKFSDLTLHQDVLKGIEAAGFSDCMPVQERVLPVALQGKDVMVQSKTGSGKTAVFLVSILEKYAKAMELRNGGENVGTPEAAGQPVDTAAAGQQTVDPAPAEPADSADSADSADPIGASDSVSSPVAETVVDAAVSAAEPGRPAKGGKPSQKSLPVALIVSPTRELAVQIEEDAMLLASGIPGFRVGCFYGGVGYGKQDKLIEEGCDLYVGTPGRLLDYQKMHKLDYRMFDTFVIDEADRLFDMGFYPDVQKMFSYMRPCKERQTMLFSATLGTRVRNLAWSYMNEPDEIEVQPEEITVKQIEQELYHVSKDDKFHLFLQLMNREQPENALIFTNTKAKAVELCKRLTLNGFKTEYLMGDMPQSKRLKTIERMKDGEIKYLVATDVAARGLQIDGLQLVVNYDIPEDFESYVHRIGRTARAGQSGKAITLACEEYIYGLEPIETYIQMKIPVIWPAEGELPVVQDKSEGMRFRDLVSEEEYAGHGGDHGFASRGGRRPSGGQRSGSRSGQGGRGGSRSTGRDSGNGPSRTRRPKPAPDMDGAAKTGQRPETGDRRPSRRVKGAKSYAEIQKMDLEERMAYYKKQYGQDLSDGASVGQTGTQDRKNAGKSSAKSGTRTGTKPGDAKAGYSKDGAAKRPGAKPQRTDGRKPGAADEGRSRNRKDGQVAAQAGPKASQAKAPQMKPVQENPAASAKKPGFFARLFGLGKKKQGQ